MPYCGSSGSRSYAPACDTPAEIDGVVPLERPARSAGSLQATTLSRALSIVMPLNYAYSIAVHAVFAARSSRVPDLPRAARLRSRTPKRPRRCRRASSQTARASAPGPGVGPVAVLAGRRLRSTALLVVARRDGRRARAWTRGRGRQPDFSSAASAAAGIRSTAASRSSSPITCATPPASGRSSTRSLAGCAVGLARRACRVHAVRRRVERPRRPLQDRPRSASRARSTIRMFFGPGYSSPFNPWNSDFTVYLISLFGAVAPMLGVKRGQTLVDSGCGYAWSTEWLFRSGIDAIGVDICRTYLEIGVVADRCASDRISSSATSRTSRWPRPRPTRSSPTRAFITFPIAGGRWPRTTAC